jgi:hypothetical protein
MNEQQLKLLKSMSDANFIEEINNNNKKKKHYTTKNKKNVIILEELLLDKHLNNSKSDDSTHFDDFYAVSHLLHRVSKVSGNLPSSSFDANENQSDNNDNNNNILNEYQLKSLKESDEITLLMNKVIELYKELKSLSSSQLIYKTELYFAVEKINNNYINLFEIMLTKVLEIQRNKFKVYIFFF